MSNETGSTIVKSMQWNDLLDVSQVEPLSDRDAPLLRDIREVLLKHGAIDRFGLTLLHKHFDLHQHEELVEEVDVERRILVTRPAPRQQAQAGIETAWRFAHGTEQAAPTVVCFVTCRWRPGSSEHSGIQDHS